MYLSLNVLLLLLLQHTLAMNRNADEFDLMMKEPLDRSHWVDPHDMGGGKRKQPVCENTCPACQHNLENLGVQLQACQTSYSLMEKLLNAKMAAETTIPSVLTKEIPTDADESSETAETDGKQSEEIYFRRFVRVILNQLGLQGDPENSHLSVEIFLSADNIKNLQKFSSAASTVSPYDADEIMVNMIQSAKEKLIKPNQFWSYARERSEEIREPLYQLCLSFCLAFSIIFTFKYFPFWKIVLVLFIVSVCWHWLHMYKTAWANKKANLVQHKEIPKECRPGELSWLHSIHSSVLSAFTNKDKCQQYHQALMVDPVYEVNPMMALADLTSSLLVRPLRVLAVEVGEACNGLLETVPLAWKVPVMLIFLFLIILLMLLVFGYKISLPFFLEIAPATTRDKSMSLTSDLTEIKMTLRQLRQTADLQLYSSTKATEIQWTLDKGQGVEQRTVLDSQTSRIEDLVRRAELEETLTRPGRVSAPTPGGVSTLASESEGVDDVFLLPPVPVVTKHQTSTPLEDKEQVFPDLRKKELVLTPIERTLTPTRYKPEPERPSVDRTEADHLSRVSTASSSITEPRFDRLRSSEEFDLNPLEKAFTVDTETLLSSPQSASFMARVVQVLESEADTSDTTQADHSQADISGAIPRGVEELGRQPTEQSPLL